MAYIGNVPLSGAYQKLDSIAGSFNGSTTAFNLTVGTVAVTPGTSQNVIISVAGVIQEPGTAYTVSGTQIVFTTAPGTGVAFFGVLLGPVGTINVPADGSVTAPKLSWINARPPNGRLTLVTGTPVMTSDQTAKSTVYYTPFNGGVIWLYDGTRWNPFAQPEVSLILNATDNTSGNIYDIFAYNNGGNSAIGTGPAWTTNTAGSSARGTGAATTELQMINGLWTNKVSITLRSNGSSLGSITANQALYLGTVYCTANGQTGMAFKAAAGAGGSNAFLGLYNAHNQKMMSGTSRDNTGSWSYGTATWRSANNNASNRVTYIDGLGQSIVTGEYYVFAESNSAACNSAIGVNFNSTTATPGGVLGFLQAQSGSATGGTLVGTDQITNLGLNYAQGMEFGNSGTTTFFAATVNELQMVRVRLEM